MLGRWLSPLVPGTGPFTYTRSKDSGKPTVVWSSDSLDLKLRAVCGPSCNNGWMRELDEAARPIISPLIQGQRLLLDESAKITLASWAAKVQLLFQYMGAPPRPVSQQRRDAMYESHKPYKNSYLWLAAYAGGRPIFARAHEVQMVRPSKPSEPLSGERFTITIGKVALQVFIGPEHPTHAVALTPVDAARPWLLPLWPDVSPITWPPSREMSDADVEVFSTFST